tara:strand:- start:44 stop:928 length:885 start_codon:yes stop_codon:yes gene_type:complete
MKPFEIKRAIIPVAGLGTRMLPATKAIPKELLPIYDKPLIQLVVEEAIDAGISEIIFVTRSGKEAIENHFDKNFELEQKLKSSKNNQKLEAIKYPIDENLKISSIRQDEPLGLGHAILTAKHILNMEPFVVMLPDELLIRKSNKNDLKKLITNFQETGSAQILVEKILKKDTSKYGMVESKKIRRTFSSFAVSRLLEKPQPEDTTSSYRIIGRYVLPYEVIENLERQKPGKNKEIQLTDAINRLLFNKINKIDAVISSSKVYDCGSKKGFIGANLEIAMKQSGMKKYLKGIIMN